MFSYDIDTIYKRRFLSYTAIIKNISIICHLLRRQRQKHSIH
nr:ALPV-046 [Albatrosspox virus]